MDMITFMMLVIFASIAMIFTRSIAARLRVSDGVILPPRDVHADRCGCGETAVISLDSGEAACVQCALAVAAIEESRASSGEHRSSVILPPRARTGRYLPIVGRS